MATNVAVGILRPPHVFFYEVDVKRNFKYVFSRLKFHAKMTLHYFSIFRTKHGYHLMGYPYSKATWQHFTKMFTSDFSIKLRPRWNKKEPQVLRISEKWDLKTGKVVSPKPKFICGNFFLEGIQNYKVMYYAK